MRQAQCEVVYDCGANSGGYAIAFANEPSVREVHCFEPIPEVFAQLQTHCGSNPKCILNKIGLSNVSEIREAVQVYNAWCLVDPKMVGVGNMGHVTEFQPFDMQLTTLDRYTKEHNIGRVDYIKMDIDGYELKALLGAVELIERDHPFFFIELSILPGKMNIGSAEEITALLDSHGYLFYPQFCDGRPVPALEAASWVYQCASFDIAVAHRSRAALIEEALDPNHPIWRRNRDVPNPAAT